MTNPNEIMWLLGYNGLSVILDQERKHWLLKTDKKKQIQDDKTGDIFQGQIDNLGSEIIIESEKLPYKINDTSSITFTPETVNDVIVSAYSALPYSAMMNGLMFARITSQIYPRPSSEGVEYKNYKLELEDCSIQTVLFGGSSSSSDVFAGKWLKTTTPPSLLMLDDVGEYSIRQVINISSDNVTYYYPLESSLQALGVKRIAGRTYQTDAVNSNKYIGYPLFWFTCDATNTGPTITFGEDNENIDGNQLVFASNAGNESKYRAKLFIDIDGHMDATPSRALSDQYTIRCYSDGNFNNSSADYNIPLDITRLSFVNNSSGNVTPFDISFKGNTTVTMSKINGWRYVSNSIYEIDMSVFDNNCLDISHSALLPIFDVHLDESIPYYISNDMDLGVAGISINAADFSDSMMEYPHQLGKWDGIPERLNSMEGSTPQHLSIYAIHNTPFYSEDIPSSRQVAAILLDPGAVKVDQSSTELSEDERGRAYLISNDDITYENNALAEHPKPARTVARICDIPTSVTDFMNVSGLVPISVVDQSYVRSEVSYTEEDRERLLNTLASRIVRPIHLDNTGHRIIDQNGGEDNEYIFNTIEGLNSVDLVSFNNFRRWINLNPKVDTSKIKLSQIVEAGSGYKINDTGIIYIGGCALDYLVKKVSSSGGVTEVSVVPHDLDIPISLSNFNMVEGNSGYTKIYGTTPTEGSDGTGLKITLMIEDYETIITQQEKIYDDLIAFVRMNDGLKMFKYIIREDTQYGEGGTWVEYTTIAEFEVSTTDKHEGNVSSSDAYMNAIIPGFKQIIAGYHETDNEMIVLNTMTTSSFINIIDEGYSPITQVGNIPDVVDDRKRVDINKWISLGWLHGESKSRTNESVLEYIKGKNQLYFDSYIIWNWTSTNENIKTFDYLITRRALNNYRSTDSVTSLPKNELYTDSYVHTNPSTTVVWDVKNIGPMMWIYSTSYDKHEIYHIDPDTQDLYIEYSNEETSGKMEWDEIEIGNGMTLDAYDDNGKLKYYIFSNSMVENPMFVPPVGKPYLQPDYECIAAPGDVRENVPRPKGNWQLVFPRVNMYSLTNQQTGVSHRSMKLSLLQTIKGRDITVHGDDKVQDQYGNIVNKKCVVINETQEGATLSIFNSETGNWEKI